MGVAQSQILRTPRKELKECNGVSCKGVKKPIDEFYTKGKRKDGCPRYESICKKCKSIKGYKERNKKKVKSKNKKKTMLVDIQDCDFEINLTNDHVREDFQRYLLDFAMDLIFELED